MKGMGTGLSCHGLSNACKLAVSLTFAVLFEIPRTSWFTEACIGYLRKRIDICQTTQEVLAVQAGSSDIPATSRPEGYLRLS